MTVEVCLCDCDAPHTVTFTNVDSVEHDGWWLRLRGPESAIEEIPIDDVDWYRAVL